MPRYKFNAVDDYPDPDDCETFEDYLEGLARILPGPLSIRFALERRQEGLPESWLWSAFRLSRDLNGEPSHTGEHWDRKRYLAATLNQLDIENAAEVIESNDARTEAEAIYIGFLDRLED